MENNGWIPNTEFEVGTNRYKVTEDYNIIYLGKNNNKNISVSNDLLRGTSIPTSQGDLPTTGTYYMRNYIYSNNYYEVGYPGGFSESVGVIVSADQASSIRVDWMDGRNNTSMGGKTYSFSGAGSLAKYVWVYSGEKFYFKIANAGSGTVSGSYKIFLD